GAKEIQFRVETGLIFHRRERLPAHPNGMRFTAFDADQVAIRTREFYSVGGGFVVGGDVDEDTPLVEIEDGALPYGFRSGAELLAACQSAGLSISTLMLENEKVWRTEAEVRRGLLER